MKNEGKTFIILIYFSFYPLRQLVRAGHRRISADPECSLTQMRTEWKGYETMRTKTDSAREQRWSRTRRLMYRFAADGNEGGGFRVRRWVQRGQTQSDSLSEETVRQRTCRSETVTVSVLHTSLFTLSIRLFAYISFNPSPRQLIWHLEELPACTLICQRVRCLSVNVSAFILFQQHCRCKIHYGVPCVFTHLKLSSFTAPIVWTQTPLLPLSHFPSQSSSNTSYLVCFSLSLLFFQTHTSHAYCDPIHWSTKQDLLTNKLLKKKKKHYQFFSIRLHLITNNLTGQKTPQNKVCSSLIETVCLYDEVNHSMTALCL